MSEPDNKTMAIARQANIKWRKWVSMSDKIDRSLHDPDVINASSLLLNQHIAYQRDHEIFDWNDGEHFSLNGWMFHFTRKGDPRLVGRDESLS